MFTTSHLSFLLLIFCININFAQFTDVINSNRPGQSMSAFSVGMTVFQTETGVNYTSESSDRQDYEGNIIDADLVLRYGAFFEQLEFIGEFEYSNETFSYPVFIGDRHDTGIKRAIVGAKYLVYDPDRNYEQKPNLYSWKANHKFNWRQFIPAVAIYGGVNVFPQRNKFLRPDIPQENGLSLRGMILTQNQFGRYTFLTNIIVDKFPSLTNSLDYVLTLTRGFNSRLSGFVEIQGQNNSYISNHFFRTGAAYLLWQNLQIDASLGKSFGNEPNIVFGGIGCSWRFDGNYSDVLLRVNKEDKRSKLDKKSDKMKEKKKDKEKKRLDAIENDPSK